MKRIITLFLAIIMLAALCACAKEETQTIQLGTSEYTITLPAGYQKEADDFDEDQIAYYYKDDESIDFDVYQWEKEDVYTLEQEAEYYAKEYNTTAVAIIINGIKVMKYVSSETYGEYTYSVVNYMFENEDSIIEICFWTVGSQEEYDDVNAIIYTLKRN